MGRTRVNIRHSLENDRDSYPFPIGEAIVTELVANCLDAKANLISINVDPVKRSLSVVDNGIGMEDDDFEKYHDLGESTKNRGEGIGFAGQGAKLALLISAAVITETKTIMSEKVKATKWFLDPEDDYNAPWDYIAPRGIIKTPTGTAVLIENITDNEILDAGYIKKILIRHFYPLLDAEFMNRILIRKYKRPIVFSLNGQNIKIPGNTGRKFFFINLTKKNTVGVGYIEKKDIEIQEENRGIAISVLGKVVKRGWEWLGINPKNPKKITGVIEIPNLSQILTTNKVDFLQDQQSRAFYYRYRRAIQEEVENRLKEWGELETKKEIKPEENKHLRKEIERILDDMVNDFPELSPLLGRKVTPERSQAILPEPNAEVIGGLTEGVDTVSGTLGGNTEGQGVDAGPGNIPGKRIAREAGADEKGLEINTRKKKPSGIQIGYVEDPDNPAPGWLTGTTCYINKGHKAYCKAQNIGADSYHEIFTVAWVLSKCLAEGKSPVDFINNFLIRWGTI